jgi:hypothetical protein
VDAVAPVAAALFAILSYFLKNVIKKMKLNLIFGIVMKIAAQKMTLDGTKQNPSNRKRTIVTMKPSEQYSLNVMRWRRNSIARVARPSWKEFGGGGRSNRLSFFPQNSRENSLTTAPLK